MKPRVLVTRANFPEVLERLRARFEVEDNQADVPLAPEALRARLADKDGAFVTGFDRIDAALLDTCPKLKAVCNLAAGYNNLDLAACTARGIVATNTPEVLNDTTADLAFALLMAAARRITESERRLRAGHWRGWQNDQFLGQDVHHAILGIVGMGRIGQALAARRSAEQGPRLRGCDRGGACEARGSSRRAMARSRVAPAPSGRRHCSAVRGPADGAST